MAREQEDNQMPVLFPTDPPLEEAAIDRIVSATRLPPEDASTAEALAPILSDTFDRMSFVQFQANLPSAKTRGKTLADISAAAEQLLSLMLGPKAERYDEPPTALLHDLSKGWSNAVLMKRLTLALEREDDLDDVSDDDVWEAMGLGIDHFEMRYIVASLHYLIAAAEHGNPSDPVLGLLPDPAVAEQDIHSPGPRPLTMFEGYLIPNAYTRWSGRKYSATLSEDGKPKGPSLRFAHAVMSELGVKRDYEALKGSRRRFLSWAKRVKPES